MESVNSVGQLEWLRNKIRSRQTASRKVVYVCMTGCKAYGAASVRDALLAAVKESRLEKEVEIRSTGCHGFCAKAPVIAIDPLGIQYQEVDPKDAPAIVRQTLQKKQLIERLAYKDPQTGLPVFNVRQIPFYARQEKRVLKNCGRIDPTRIEDYIAQGGYEGLAKALSLMVPEQVIENVTAAKLKGRGGAGFPTGKKWAFARQASKVPKYIICNADEGDPGAFMDRAVLEGDPHVIIEGMLIGAFAIGASHGIIYVREEYPIAVKHLTLAIEAATALGLLGSNILGTGFDFSLSLKKGAGAFVCGEETALMASVEGKRGMPRARPPFPVESGVGGHSTTINNVETLANIPLILKNGPDWYGRVGTPNSKGAKIFSLAGKVNNTGLVEVPLGGSIREVIFDIGGGIPRGRAFKAVQMGGPSGGCVPTQYLDLPIDYDTLQRIGAIMGSGGMVVLDENNCMVEIARFFLSFTQSESCGKCAPCRLGTKQLLEILTRITHGKGRMTDIATIEDLGATITEASLCGLGQTCAKPALSTLIYFRSEYEEHIRESRCAGAVYQRMVLSPCQHACPAGIDVPNYVAAIACGNYGQSVDIIRERNPFPAVCGRICIHPCETKCRRGELDDAVAIRTLKRFASDWYFANVGLREQPFALTRSQKVAIVGAGPAGLTCAYYLRQKGYPTTVFEAEAYGGGMLGLAIPEFRLPRQVIEMEIKYIESCGVEIRYSSPIDANHTVNDLLADGYGAVFIAAGAQASKHIGIPGEAENPVGLYYGLNFLMDVRNGRKTNLAGRVIVIGGGNVAFDTARTSLRVGAGDVQIFYRRTVAEMPAWEKDIAEAIEEGIVINPSWTPKKILQAEGKVTGMVFCQSQTQVDETGRAHIEVNEEIQKTVAADAIIIAVGQAPDISFIAKDSQLERTLWGSLEVDDNTLSTTVPGIFAGGDFTTGPSTVINSIASGRRGALAVDQYLTGNKDRIQIVDEKTAFSEDAVLALANETLAEIPRVAIQFEATQTRVQDFREVEKGFSEKQAGLEAKRCLRCDLEVRDE